VVKQLLGQLHGRSNHDALRVVPRGLKRGISEVEVVIMMVEGVEAVEYEEVGKRWSR
jgi:hypothetical protein